MSTIWQHILSDESKTQNFGEILASFLSCPLTLTFQGDLGAGKTTLIRAMLRQLGVQGPIKSPTYSLVETYTPAQSIQNAESYEFHHFDLYRIASPEELEYLGFREYFAHNAICCIEWPEKAAGMIGAVDLALQLTHLNEGRRVQIEALSSAGQRCVESLRRHFIE